MGLGLIEPDPREPAIRQVHADLFHQPPLAGDAVEIANQENAQQNLRVDRRPAGVAVVGPQARAHETEINLALDQPQQMGLRNMVFEFEVIK